MIALEGCGLGRRYGGFTAVHNVDLRIPAGEIHGLIGPNGAGKSTVIEILSGRRGGRSNGRVRLNGQDITRAAIGERRSLGLSRSFQRTSVFPTLTIRDQLQVAARKTGASRSDVVEIMSELELGDIAGCPADMTSYGDQRRLDLALALVGRPSVLLLDEPASGLTAQESLRLADHLRSLVTRWRVTVLLVEHDMEVVFRVCDRITVMQLGRKLAEGTPAEIRRDGRVITAYLGSEA